jgi:hypothetical protein
VIATEIRQRSPTELVDASFQFLRRFYAPLVTICAIAMVPAVLARIIARHSMGYTSMITTAPGPWIAVAAIGFVCAVIADSILVVAISSGYLHGAIDIAHTFRAGARRIFALAIATLIRYSMVAVVVIVAFVVLVIILATEMAIGGTPSAQSELVHARFAVLVSIPFVLVLVAYPLLRTFPATMIVMLEDSVGRAAVKRSIAMTKGHTAHVFFTLGLSLILYMVAALLSAVLAVKLLTPTTAGIVQSLVIIPIFPFFTVAKTLLYYDLRVRREGFDLEVILRDLDDQETAAAGKMAYGS